MRVFDAIEEALIAVSTNKIRSGLTVPTGATIAACLAEGEIEGLAGRTAAAAGPECRR